MNAMKLDAKLKKLCGARRWGQKDLLEAMGPDADVSSSSMSNYFSGKHEPDLKTAMLMARALDVTLDYLADDRQDDPPTGKTDPDAQAIVDLFRALKLTRMEGLRRLATEPESVKKETSGPGRIHAVRDETSGEVGRRRQQRSAVKPKGDHKGTEGQGSPVPAR